MGVKAIIGLRQPSGAMEEEHRLVEQLGMRWVNIPMWFWWRPSDRQVHQFLSIVRNPANRPVFVHCRQGWNRVGIMTASTGSHIKVGSHTVRMPRPASLL